MRKQTMAKNTRTKAHRAVASMNTLIQSVHDAGDIFDFIQKNGKHTWNSWLDHSSGTVTLYAITYRYKSGSTDYDLPAPVSINIQYNDHKKPIATVKVTVGTDEYGKTVLLYQIFNGNEPLQTILDKLYPVLRDVCTKIGGCKDSDQRLADQMQLAKKYLDKSGGNYNLQIGSGNTGGYMLSCTNPSMPAPFYMIVTHDSKDYEKRKPPPYEAWKDWKQWTPYRRFCDVQYILGEETIEIKPSIEEVWFEEIDLNTIDLCKSNDYSNIERRFKEGIAQVKQISTHRNYLGHLYNPMQPLDIAHFLTPKNVLSARLDALLQAMTQTPASLTLETNPKTQEQKDFLQSTRRHQEHRKHRPLPHAEYLDKAAPPP